MFMGENPDYSWLDERRRPLVLWPDVSSRLFHAQSRGQLWGQSLSTKHWDFALFGGNRLPVVRLIGLFVALLSNVDAISAGSRSAGGSGRVGTRPGRKKAAQNSHKFDKLVQGSGLLALAEADTQ